MIEAAEQLTRLLLQEHSYPVAFDRAGSYNHRQFITELKQAIANIRKLPHNSYLLFVEHSYDFAINFVALLLDQKDITLTANPKPEWIAAIDSQFDAIIGDPELQPALNGDHFRSPLAPVTGPQLQVPNAFDSRIRFFTSGSTSEPKAVTKSVSQLLLEVSVINHTFGHSVAGCQFMASVSHHHIYGLLFRLLWPLIYRYPFAAEMVLYPEQLIEFYHQQPSICLISSPAFLSRQDAQLEPIQLRQCFSSGSLLSKLAAQSSYRQLGIYPIEVFGSTETGGIGYRSQADENQLWTLFPGITLDLAANQPPLLHSPYLDHPVPLDDALQLVTANQFQLLGRLDRVVKIEEKRVSLDAIEQSLKLSPLVQEVKLVVLSNRRTCLGAVIELSEQGKQQLRLTSKQQLNRQLKAQLAETYEAVAIPRKWRYLEQLPYNSQGKLPLTKLKALF